MHVAGQGRRRDDGGIRAAHWQRAPTPQEGTTPPPGHASSYRRPPTLLAAAALVAQAPGRRARGRQRSAEGYSVERRRGASTRRRTATGRRPRSDGMSCWSYVGRSSEHPRRGQGLPGRRSQPYPSLHRDGPVPRRRPLPTSTSEIRLAGRRRGEDRSEVAEVLGTATRDRSMCKWPTARSPTGPDFVNI